MMQCVRDARFKDFPMPKADVSFILVKGGVITAAEEAGDVTTLKRRMKEKKGIQRYLETIAELLH